MQRFCSILYYLLSLIYYLKGGLHLTPTFIIEPLKCTQHTKEAALTRGGLFWCRYGAKRKTDKSCAKYV